MEDVLSHMIILLYPSPAPPVPVASPPLLPLITHFKALIEDHVSAPTTHTLASIKRAVPGLLDIVFGRTVNEYKTGTVPNEIRPFVSHGLLGTMDVPTAKNKQTNAASSAASKVTGTLSNALGGLQGSPPKSPTPNQNPGDFCLLVFSRSAGSLLSAVAPLPPLTVPLNPGSGYYTAIPPQSLRWLLDPDAVLECARRPASTNEDYHVPRCTRALWCLDSLSSAGPSPDDMVTDSGPLPPSASNQGLDHSPLSCYVTGANGFAELCAGDKTKARVKLSVEEDVIIRLVQASVSGYVQQRGRAPVDCSSSASVAPGGSSSRQRRVGRSRPTLRACLESALRRGRVKDALVVSEWCLCQYGIRPATKLDWRTLRSRAGGAVNDLCPPPVRIKEVERGYVGSLDAVRHLWTDEVSLDVMEQGLYSCFLYVFGTLDAGVYDVGSGHGYAGFRICELFMWLEAWSDFVEEVVLGRQGRGDMRKTDEEVRASVARHFHLLWDGWAAISTRVAGMDPERKDLVEASERCMRSYVKVKALVEDVAAVADTVLRGSDGGELGRLYAAHCERLGGYRPAGRHPGPDVVECWSEFARPMSRLSGTRRGIEGGLREGWGEGVRARGERREVSKGVERRMGLLTDKGREEVLRGSRIDPEEIIFVGDRMLLPAGEWESAVLVDFWVWISMLINGKLGLKSPEGEGETWKERVEGMERGAKWRVDLRFMADWRNLGFGFVLWMLMRKCIF